MCVTQEKVEKLLNGIDGQEIICELREYYASSFWSFKTAVSKIRQSYMKYNRRHPEFLADMNAVEAKIGEILNQEDFDMFQEKIQNFKTCSLNEQYDILRLGHIHKSKKLQNLFKEIRLLPDNMQTFHLSKDEIAESQEKNSKSIIKRNEKIICVQNSGEVWEEQISILEHGSSNQALEILALLFVSGRRECEILNGRSVFVEVENMPFHTEFTGQLKKQKNVLIEEDEQKYVIPLLCSFRLFQKALIRFRQKQKSDVSQMTNKQISQRYKTRIFENKHIFPMIRKVHDLRCLYISYVNVLFQHNTTIPNLCMICLGHSDMHCTLHYMNTKIERYENIIGRHGNLCWKSFPQC
jgi:hypothetical protein